MAAPYDCPMPADLVIVNGRLFTGGDARSADRWLAGSRDGPAPDGVPDAVAIAAGRIAWLGATSDARPWLGPETDVIDAHGGLVAPGFEDAHAHLRMGAESLLTVDLDSATNIGDVREALRRWDGAHAHARTEWLVGRGWHYGIFPGGIPDRARLDELVPDRPAVLESFDGHTHWLNSAALARAGIVRGGTDPPGGIVERDPVTSEPTGILKEYGEWLHTELLPQAPDAVLDEALRQAAAMIRRSGITAVQEAWTELADLRRYARLRTQDPFDLRLRVALPADPIDWADGPERGRQRWGERIESYRAELAAAGTDEWLDGGIVKAFADGVIESGTAWMLDPYEPGATLAGEPAGQSTWPPGALAAMTEMAVEAGWQVEIHAIGDAAIRASLDAHEAAGALARGRPASAARNGGEAGAPSAAAGAGGRAPGPRGRIEHVEWPDPADVPRFGAFGVVASMQPSHARSMPMEAAVRERQIGARVGRGWPWASILRAGGVVAFGSDWPIAPFDPLVQLHAAVTRADAAGWLPAERLTVAEALACATWGGAYAARAEDRRGSLVAGHDADVVILDRDLLDGGPSAVPGTRIVATICGGRVVYRAG